MEDPTPTDSPAVTARPVPTRRPCARERQAVMKELVPLRIDWISDYRAIAKRRNLPDD